VSKSVARGGGHTSYRGLVQINKGAHGSRSSVKCDALLVDTISRSDTYPYVDIREDDVTMGHEATVSKVSEDQLFYLMSRGMTEDEAMAMVVRGFVEPIARELPMGKETAWEQVQAILDGVRDKVKYEQDPKNVFKGAIGALRDGKADREDLTATFVAVCRAAKIPARMVWAMDYCYAEFYLEERPDADAAADADEKGVKEKKSAKESKTPKGAWYPCIVHEQKELGACADFRPIMEKGDNFKVPEEKTVQRFVKEFLTGKGGTGGKPSVEFRRRNAD
jgi:hypothetical protein